MLEKFNNLKKRDKGIIGGIVAFVSIAIIATLFITLTPAGKNVREDVNQAFKPVELPANSRELTEVPEPPTSQKDSSDDDYVNVDMMGQKIKEAEVDVPVEVTPERGNRDESAPRTTVESRPAPRAEEMNQVSNIGVRFSIPSIGLDTTYGMVDEVNGVLRPTNFTSVFGVRNRGVAYNQTNNGTAYAVTHTLDEGGIAPGNFLFDASNNNQPRISKGEQIKIGNQTFTIDDFYRDGKGLISSNKELWDSSIKNRLVLIVCYPNSADNYVVVAKK